MVTVTDFDERREVRADRVWSWPGGERPSWREFRQAALDLEPDRQELAADDLLAAGSCGRTPSRWAWPARGRSSSTRSSSPSPSSSHPASMAG
jgi:hypothetical protein